MSNDALPHIAIGTRVMSGNSTLYRDGVQVAQNASDNTGLSAPTKFGIGNHDIVTAGGQFAGQIMEVMVYT